MGNNHKRTELRQNNHERIGPRQINHKWVEPRQIHLMSRKIIIALLIEFAFFVVLVVLTLKFVHGTKNRSLVIGLVCIVFNILMYASPLTVMRSRILKT
ncbi:hypothetical protein QQ045_010051 [Rhodiola kirilowii]